MSSTFCTVVLSALPVKSKSTPSEVTRFPLVFEHCKQVIMERLQGLVLPRLELDETFTDRYTDFVALAIKDGDVDIRGQVTAFPEWGEIRKPSP